MCPRMPRGCLLEEKKRGKVSPSKLSPSSSLRAGTHVASVDTSSSSTVLLVSDTLPQSEYIVCWGRVAWIYIYICTPRQACIYIWPLISNVRRCAQYLLTSAFFIPQGLTTAPVGIWACVPLNAPLNSYNMPPLYMYIIIYIFPIIYIHRPPFRCPLCDLKPITSMWMCPKHSHWCNLVGGTRMTGQGPIILVWTKGWILIEFKSFCYNYLQHSCR